MHISNVNPSELKCRPDCNLCHAGGCLHKKAALKYQDVTPASISRYKAKPSPTYLIYPGQCLMLMYK